MANIDVIREAGFRMLEVARRRYKLFALPEGVVCSRVAREGPLSLQAYLTGAERRV